VVAKLDLAAAKPVVELLRQRARPYLFSNALPPAIVGAGIAAIDISEREEERRVRLFKHAARFRMRMTELGFTLQPGEHPIIPVMLGEAKLAQDFARAAFEEGVYVTGFFYPVVPMGKARVRTQMSAALTDEDLEAAIAAFERAGQRLGLI
jgi:glycine C-acetyltransferase